MDFTDYIGWMYEGGGLADVMSEAAAIARVPLRIRAVKQVDDCRFADGALEVLDLTNVAAGVPHSGHTEILASLSGTRDRVLRTIRLARLAMDRLGRPGARIAVAGLNPHAGEEGLFGDEKTMERVLKETVARCVDGTDPIVLSSIRCIETGVRMVTLRKPRARSNL